MAKRCLIKIFPLLQFRIKVNMTSDIFFVRLSSLMKYGLLFLNSIWTKTMFWQKLILIFLLDLYLIVSRF